MPQDKSQTTLLNEPLDRKYIKSRRSGAAQAAYDVVKAEKKPASAKEMALAWVEHVKAMVSRPGI